MQSQGTELVLCNLIVGATVTFRRQIDITTYQIRKIKADTSLCLFADDFIVAHGKTWISSLILSLAGEDLAPVESEMYRKDC